MPKRRASRRCWRSLQAQVQAEFGHADRKVFVTSGTSGGLLLSMMALVNPGDEVILFDPYFVTYEPLVKLMGGRAVLVDTYPEFSHRFGSRAGCDYQQN